MYMTAPFLRKKQGYRLKTMENFDHQHQENMKEKQFYLLHLDTPRIIIVSSVIIGLIVISFLMGMNFIGGDSSSQQIAANNSFKSMDKNANLLDESIPSPLMNRSI